MITNSNFLIPKLLQPDVVDLSYFKYDYVSPPLGQTDKVLNIKELPNQVAKIIGIRKIGFLIVEHLLS